MPMQPSMQVTHMPDAGVIDPSVRFFVRVALDVLTLEKDIYHAPFWIWSFFGFACHAGRHVTHHIVKLFLLDAGWTEVRTASADCSFRLRKGTAGLTGGADLHAASAEPADVGADIKGCSDASVLTTAAKTDGSGHHLFFAHAHAQPAKNTVLMLLPEALPPHIKAGRYVLNLLGLRTGRQQQFDDHSPRLHHALRSGSHLQPLFNGIGAG